MSTTEVQTISPAPPVRKMASKSQRLVRTSSLEKIRRFNSFICSQQYNILPALLAWLRSSQAVLRKAEKTILFFRALFFSHFLYKIYQFEYRTSFENLRKHTLVLKLAVYATAVVLLAELGLCFYLLCSTHVPSGLVFLIISFFYIIYLNVRSVYFARESRDDKKRN
ncbi:uncharacterized protein LOC662907 [Tribolium castaneum]|uniref:Uncharacterized protein n=1 Tax=Tribolium castaneum TaxID=7070 RepID=D2A5B8_TRICA|nr:PREDICTED: uncharacterized protein LOC662907 [Tribolium castaneum]XP_015836354.1 PREDICTED: uncharacterized protein LOC662907 [Tribolium castaneum]EFA05344.1 hypothetical protein TcasGA2_TC015508 [Tribolium castaneum]|eukprot:XP_008194657.1 PREDICTED: uncharacterized protein LOC662907 [Tribolium castaneum]